MYQLIENNYAQVLAHISRQHISDYDWLSDNSHRPEDADFQSVFRKFWALNAARLGERYCVEYFRLLGVATPNDLGLEAVVRQLYEVPSNSSQRKSLQFSFATKLLHMRHPDRPIYDNQVAAFYFFSGGMMPSWDYLTRYQDDLTLLNRWEVNGGHYALTLHA